MMSHKTPHILLTNDDGIGSLGLKALTSAMKKVGEVWVVAPERPQNAVGRALTLHKPLRSTQLGKQVFAINGTPADCVTLAVGKLMEQHPPSLLVSGINQGLNLGDDVTNSGTVSGAMEGRLHGIPSIAVSQEDHSRSRYKMAAAFTARLASMILRNCPLKDLLFNVNIPACPIQEISGITFTSLSQRRYMNQVVEKVDPRGEKYYWIAGERITWHRKELSDFQAISQHMISITPLHLDMTEYQSLKALRSWGETLEGCMLVESPTRKPVAAKQRT